MQQIAKAEDIEFSKLNASINEVIRNMFVFTANETGVKRYEKLLGIKPKAAQSLDDRKIYILSMMNRRKMSLSELENMLSGHSPGLKLIMDMYDRKIDVVINSDRGDLRAILKIMEEILPLDIYIRFVRRLRCFMAIRYRNAVYASAKFYPRIPVRTLKLDGRWKLDGTHRLSGYDTDDYLDYYPVRAAAGTKIFTPVSWQNSVSGYACADAAPGYHTEMSARTAVYIHSPERDCGRMQAAARTSAQLGISAGDGSVRIMNHLDGRWKLDGRRKLNAGVYPL